MKRGAVNERTSEERLTDRTSKEYQHQQPTPRSDGPRRPRPAVQDSPACGAAARGFRGRDETCPVSTEGGTRRVQLVREGGGGGAPRARAPSALLARAAREARGHRRGRGAGRAPSDGRDRVLKNRRGVVHRGIEGQHAPPRGRAVQPRGRARPGRARSRRGARTRGAAAGMRGGGLDQRADVPLRRGPLHSGYTPAERLRLQSGFPRSGYTRNRRAAGGPRCRGGRAGGARAPRGGRAARRRATPRPVHCSAPPPPPRASPPGTCAVKRRSGQTPQRSNAAVVKTRRSGSSGRPRTGAGAGAHAASTRWMVRERCCFSSRSAATALSLSAHSVRSAAASSSARARSAPQLAVVRSELRERRAHLGRHGLLLEPLPCRRPWAPRSTQSL